MILKEYRLKEKEVKKVLKIWKPFFSYWIVLNSLVNKLSYNKFSIVIWSKSVNTNVTRNFFRRFFYNKIHLFTKKSLQNNKYLDLVFIVKKQTKLDKKDKKTIISFEKDLDFLIKKIFK